MNKGPRNADLPLCYCTNVHPGETLEELLDVVRGPAAAVGWALGLWLPAEAARALAGSQEAADRLAQALREAGLRLLTVNAFPYGGFHAGRVKQQVYRPDWTDPARLEYTLDVARALVRLADAGGLDRASAGGLDRPVPVSTLGVGWPADGPAGPRMAAAAEAYIRAAMDLARIREETGLTLALAIEPEPATLLPDYAGLVAFHREHLLPAARRVLDEETLARHLGACLDSCHADVAFEDPARVLQDLAAAGVPVHKVQCSSALRLDPRAPGALAALAPFAEDRYLHQTAGRLPAGHQAGDRILRATDLPELLPAPPPPWGDCEEWRVHYHVPLSRGTLPPLGTTRDGLEGLLDLLRAEMGKTRGHVTSTCPRFAVHAWPVLEVETYTWGVLPPGLRPDGPDGLARGIAGELAWVFAQCSGQATVSP